MYAIDTPTPSPAFLAAWQFAGRDLSVQGQGALNWIRAHLHPPLVDHLSFRIGNQIFCVLIDVVETDGTSSLSAREIERLIAFCRTHRLVGLRYILQAGSDEQFRKGGTGWNLFDFITGEPINPLDMVSDELIEMSAWEIHDAAVQAVCNSLQKDGRQVTSWQTMLDLDPSVWFREGDNDYWCVVRAAVFPALTAARPSNLDQIAQSCKQRAAGGYFASVGLVNADDAFDPSGGIPALPLHRGHGMYIRFEGIEKVA